MVLCFALGLIARAVRSDLRLPNGAYNALAIYLLLAIGLKGGVALSKASLADVAVPLLATVVLGSLIPLVAFSISRSVGKLSSDNSAALAAHYGSVSAVTFIACLSYLERVSLPYEGFVPAMVAVMEIPGIVVALLLARRAANTGGNLKEAMHEILSGKSIVLLAGGMAIGWISGPKGYASVEPFFVEPFKGALCVFMIDMGMLAVDRLGELKKVGWFVIGAGLAFPLMFGAAGVLVGHFAGLSVGGAAVLGTLSASASYIAAPAAVRIALPAANPTLYLTAAVGITFPFNLALGIPVYAALAQMLG